MPKHQVDFLNALHWDYLPPGSPCGAERGPCTLTKGFATDMVTMFFAKYLPPESSPNLWSHIPDSRMPPALSLTFDQAFYAGGHLYSFDSSTSGPDCHVTSVWEMAGGNGSVIYP